jgi:uncharacterized protein DUF4143
MRIDHPVVRLPCNLTTPWSICFRQAPPRPRCSTPSNGGPSPRSSNIGPRNAATGWTPTRRPTWSATWRTSLKLRDLEAFAHCHRLAALRAGKILSYADLARDAGLPITTVRRYLRYLDLSYQTLHLPAWSGSPRSV